MGRPRGRPLRRNPARAARLVLAVVLLTQLRGAGALGCGLGEYAVGTECCPMCAAGLRVFKHCTANSSTTCIPCVDGTYTDQPNGLKHCHQCKLCDEGANLVPAAACTRTRNTVCACPPGYFCSYGGAQDCELCQRHSACFPGSMLKESGTNTTDNVCEACPPGTSSTADMPYTCTPWPRHEESGPRQGEDGNPSSDYSVAALVCAAAVALLAAAGLAWVWQRRKRRSLVPRLGSRPKAVVVTWRSLRMNIEGDLGDGLLLKIQSGQQGQTLMGNVDNGDQTTVPVQESDASPEEIRLE